MRTALVVFLAFSSLVPQQARAEVHTVMVLPFTGDDVKEEVLTGLQGIFMEEARKIPGYNIPDLTARALMMNNECRGDPQCLGKGLARLGATEFVYTEVSRPDRGGFQLRQSMHEAPSGSLVRDSVSVLKGKGEQLENLAFRAAALLISPEQLKGGLGLDVNVGGATIMIDGERVGESPLAGPYGGLTEGRHKVRVTKEGYGAFEQAVQITFGEVTQLDVRLTRDAQKEFSSSPPSASRPPPLIALGVAGVGAAVTGGGVLLFALVGAALLGATAYLAETITTDARNGTFILPQDEPLLRLWQAAAAGTVVSAVVAVAAGLLGIAATGAGTAGALGYHFTRPLPVSDTQFVDPAARRSAKSRPAKTRVETSETDEPAPEPPPPPPKPKTKKSKSPVQEEENLPEGE